MRHLGKRLLFAALLLVMAIVPALADAAVDEFWEYAYQVDYDCYVASPDGIGLNFRHGAGSEYGKVFDSPIPMDTKLHISQETVSSKGSKWGYTTYNGEYGWVYLAETTTTKPASAADDFWSRAYEVDYTAYVNSPDGIGVNFRSGPDSSYGKVLDDPIPMKTALHIEQETTSVKNSKWGYTAYNGQHGWVYLAELTTEKPAGAPAQTPAAEPASTEPAEPADPAPTAEPDDVAPVHPIPVADEQPAHQPDTPLTLAIIAIVILVIAVTALLLLLLRKNKTKS